MYCPAGTAPNSASPVSFVFAVWVDVDVADLMVRSTFATARFCSSTVETRTDPNTCALPVRAAKSAASNRRQVAGDRFAARAAVSSSRHVELDVVNMGIFSGTGELGPTGGAESSGLFG